MKKCIEKKDIYFYLDLFFLMQKHKIILKFKTDPTFLMIGTRILKMIHMENYRIK